MCFCDSQCKVIQFLFRWEAGIKLSPYSVNCLILKNGLNLYRQDFVTFNIILLPSIWHFYFMFMFMLIGGTPIETFSTPIHAIVRVNMSKKIAPVRFACWNWFFAHLVTFDDIMSKSVEVHIFCPSVTCCYGSNKPLAITLMWYNTITKYFNGLGIVVMVTYSYAIHYIKSNDICFIYQRLLWAMILHSNNLSSRYMDVEPLPNFSYHVK